MGNIEDESKDESRIKDKIHDWLARQAWTEDEKIKSIMDEKNAVFDEAHGENIKLDKIEADKYLFTVCVTLYASHAKDEALFFGHTVYIIIEGLAFMDKFSEDWKIEDGYKINFEDWNKFYQYNRDGKHSKEPITCADELLAYISDFSKRFWYRGHANESWRLETHLARFAREIKAIKKLEIRDLSKKLENNLRRDFKKRASLLMPSIFEDIHTLTFSMQHYGLPTRLLDWTSSPFIALYFAVCDDENKNNGCIWALDYRALNSYYKIEQLKETDESYKSLYVDYSDGHMAIHAPYVNERMQAQHSEFTLHANSNALDNEIDAHYFLKEKLVIDKNIKADLRRKLSSMGIDGGFLFPDLDNIADAVFENRKKIEKNET